MMMMYAWWMFRVCVGALSSARRLTVCMLTGGRCSHNTSNRREKLLFIRVSNINISFHKVFKKYMREPSYSIHMGTTTTTQHIADNFLFYWLYGGCTWHVWGLCVCCGMTRGSFEHCRHNDEFMDGWFGWLDWLVRLNEFAGDSSVTMSPTNHPQ